MPTLLDMVRPADLAANDIVLEDSHVVDREPGLTVEIVVTRCASFLGDAPSATSAGLLARARTAAVNFLRALRIDVGVWRVTFGADGSTAEPGRVPSIA